MKHPATDSMTEEQTIREQILKALEQFDHFLPAQAPLKDFVHHNTLHGFEHLDFPDALKAAEAVTGIHGYLALDEFRKFYSSGRILHEDLLPVLEAQKILSTDSNIYEKDGIALTQQDIVMQTLLHDYLPVTGLQLLWQINEQNALHVFQDDVESHSRELLINRCSKKTTEYDAINDLWNACLESQDLQHFIFHPEDIMDLNPDNAEKMLSDTLAENNEDQGQPVVERLVLKEADYLLKNIIDSAGTDSTLCGILNTLTNVDLLQDIRPLTIRFIASFIDQGSAAWHSSARQLGFYRFWRDCSAIDSVWNLEGMSEYVEDISSLPDDAMDTLIDELKKMGIPKSRWIPYLKQLALEIPGWSGMVMWRQQNPGYDTQHPAEVTMVDYLAVRLVLERLFARKLCRDTWGIDASLDMLRWYFKSNRHQLQVRCLLYTTRLPEYLTTQAQHLIHGFSHETDDQQQWQHLAHMIWTWRQNPSTDRRGIPSVNRTVWRLFRVAQHLALPAEVIRDCSQPQINLILSALDLADKDQKGFIWLQAYENHYQDQFFNALKNNQGRGRWSDRQQRPQAQIVFCMDDREESIRRHLEELNPQIETMGAAGFFGVAVNWLGLDDDKVSPLCPVVVDPAHEIHEKPLQGYEHAHLKHQKRLKLRQRITNIVFHETRRNLLIATAQILINSMVALPVLVAKLFAPFTIGRLSQGLRKKFDVDIPTTIHINSNSTHAATPDNPRFGFTDKEQADRVLGFLQMIGLQQGLGHLVVLMGHGSGSQNNPHLAAYDCGACSGRHGGPNARIFAQIANRPKIRTMLAERGLVIPQDTWFVGAEHNTCDDIIHWYDSNLLPSTHQEKFSKLQQELERSTLYSAHERSRRFVSAPNNLSPQKALNHVIGRSMDFSQARPELGHAANAAAIIGRRSISQGAFFDRRVFLISYDPTQDLEGDVLERILLAAGPVGAGINLEYYFSTVDNEQFGCGSKVTHNITGLLGVMEGASSDLRTGLPRQMIEVHEAMRLQILVEARLEVVAKIYERQAPLQQLIGNGWLLVSVIDPDTHEITLFKPQQGFIPWDKEIVVLPTVDCSSDWYNGHLNPLSPALIKQGAH